METNTKSFDAGVSINSAKEKMLAIMAKKFFCLTVSKLLQKVVYSCYKL